MDERLRAAERAFEASGSPADREALYTERARRGEFVPPLAAGCWLERELARSGAGTCWHGVHAKTGVSCLVRTYRLRDDRHRHRLQVRFERCGRVAHPAVPAILERTEAELELHGERGPHLVVREALLDSAIALQRLGRQGHQPWRQVLGYAIPLCGALAATRDAGLVHRAVSPGRVLIDTTGAAFLAGFRHVAPLPGTEEARRALTRPGTAIGAPYYMPPEQVRGGPVTTASDVYALGATLYDALCRQIPFTGQTVGEVTQAIFERPVPDPREHVPDLPEAVASLIVQTLDKDPLRRPTPELLAESCRALLADEPLPEALVALMRRGWLSTVWNALRG